MRILQLLAALVACSVGSLAIAGPSNSDSHAMMSARPHNPSQSVLQESQRLLSQIAEDLTGYEANFENDRYKKASLRELKRISTTLVRSRQCKRLCEQLIHLQEPAGNDLLSRHKVLDQRVSSVIVKYKGVSGCKTIISQLETTAESLAKNKAKLLTGLEEALTKGEVDATARRFYAMWDEVEEPLVWQPANKSGPLRTPFVRFDMRLKPEIKKETHALAARIITELLRKQTPPFARFLKNIEASVKAVGANGSADWGGQVKEGPDLLAAWMVGWRQAHLMSLRSQALEWSLPPDTSPSEQPSVGPAYADFQTRMIGAVVALIEADAARVSAADMPALYERYISALAQIIPQISDESLQNAVEPALAKMLEKSPAFATAVEGYTRATSEVLRWRNRQARACARRYRGDTVALEQMLLQAAQPEARVARDTSANQDVHQLHVAAPLLVEDVSRLAIGKQVEGNHFAPVGQTHANSRWEKFAFVRSLVATIPADKIDALKRDLLVSPSAGPLSLEAAIAIHTAEHGYFQAIGGPVVAVELDSYLGRTINLPKDARVMVGSLAADKPNEPLRQLLWRVEIKPAWLQHEYIFSTAP